MAQCKTAVSPVLMQWRYCSLALSHRYRVKKNWFQTKSYTNLGVLCEVQCILAATHQGVQQFLFLTFPLRLQTLPVVALRLLKCLQMSWHTILEISAGLWTLTGKIWLGPATFPSLSYNFGKIMLRSSKFQILFWRLDTYAEISGLLILSNINLISMAYCRQN